MQAPRRAFLKWTAVLGLLPFAGVSLFAQSARGISEPVGSTHLDEFFDPDGWL